MLIDQLSHQHSQKAPWNSGFVILHLKILVGRLCAKLKESLFRWRFVSVVYNTKWPWCRHGAETLSALLMLCEGNSVVTLGFLSQRSSKTNLWGLLFYKLLKKQQQNKINETNKETNKQTERQMVERAYLEKNWQLTKQNNSHSSRRWL